MATIYIDYRVSADAIARVRAMLDETAAHDPNWNGAEFQIERDDATWVETADQINGASLLADVFRAIDQQ